jgi:hypothetical protein
MFEKSFFVKLLNYDSIRRNTWIKHMHYCVAPSRFTLLLLKANIPKI